MDRSTICTTLSLLMLACAAPSEAYNLQASSAVTAFHPSGDPNTYFGYTVALYVTDVTSG